MGRWFTPEEAPLSGAGRPVMVITHRLWQRLFDGAPDVIGRSVKIQEVSATVIGVMPERYRGFSQDLHTDYIENFRWLQELSDIAYRNDALIVAGDISDRLEVIRETLRLLRGKFRHVFFTPGNHELWVRGADIHSKNFSASSISVTKST